MRRNGQVWIETVIYTLIGLTLIAMTLGYLMPKINQSNDRAAVEQSIEALNLLDRKVVEVGTNAAGSSRVIPEFLIKKGYLTVKADTNDIIFTIEDLGVEYSEPGVSIKRGRIEVKTETNKDKFKTTLRVHYDADITYSGTQSSKRFNPAATPYQFSITNVNNLNIDIKEIS
ncbi:hypothetical protein FJZ18_04425 [Candidatus Pacearchaeota archaeon]|nr:hypothetical protein [Candidatus Pacearchaeota archaeon]